MGVVRRRYTKKSVYKMSLTTVMLIFLIALLAYFILKTDYLTPGVDELTASYISFNNLNSTDMLKISNITKMTDKKGKSKNNLSGVSFEINGNKNEEYEIVLYPLGNNIDNKYIKFYLRNNNEVIENNLSKLETKEDGSKIIYSGKINDEGNFIVRMWIDNNLDIKVKNISYEVKIKQR